MVRIPINMLARKIKSKLIKFMEQNSDYLKKVLLYIASFYARISPYYVTFLRLKDSISIAWKGWDRTDNEK